MKDNILVLVIVALVSIAVGGIVALARVVWTSPPGTKLYGADITATTNGFTLRTNFKPCEARVTNGQWTIHFKR